MVDSAFVHFAASMMKHPKEQLKVLFQRKSIASSSLDCRLTMMQTLTVVWECGRGYTLMKNRKQKGRKRMMTINSLEKYVPQ